MIEEPPGLVVKGITPSAVTPQGVTARQWPPDRSRVEFAKSGEEDSSVSIDGSRLKRGQTNEPEEEQRTKRQKTV
jgi:hypothetical protein